MLLSVDTGARPQAARQIPQRRRLLGGENNTDSSNWLGWSDPSITPYMWDGDNQYPQECGTIYFAVKR